MHEQRFHLDVVNVEHHIRVNDKSYTGVTDIIAEAGNTVVIEPKIADLYAFGTFQWSDGSTGRSLTFDNIQSSQLVSFTYTCGETELSATYKILLPSEEPYFIESGNYLLEDTRTGLYMTNNGGKSPVFEPLLNDETPDATQVWTIKQSEHNGKYRYHFMSIADNAHLGTTGNLSTTHGSTAAFFAKAADQTDYIIFHSSSYRYWSIDEGNTLTTTVTTELYGFPFRVIPTGEATGINTTDNSQFIIHNDDVIYDLQGRRIMTSTKDQVQSTSLPKGLYIINGKKVYRR